MHLSHLTLLRTATTLAILMTARLYAATPEPEQTTQRKTSTMEIKRSGSQPSTQGSTDWFTGTVRIDPLFPPNAPSRVSAGSVTFEPGARTAWHTHPLGQTLIITAGCGWVQREDGPIEEVHPG